MADGDEKPHDTDPAVADTQAPESGGASDVPYRTVASDPPKAGSAPRTVRAGDTLADRYELGEELGEGGMATVFRARDKQLRRDVAVKVLFPHLARRTEVVRRFHREARAAAALEHANILRIYDVGGGTAVGDTGELDPPFIVMELIRGRTLLQEIEQRNALLAEIVACIGALLADALAAAHKAGIIHRDIKPSNVLIAHGGRLLLADFGVARLETEDSLVTRTGSLLGTPAYMSPEQASGDTATAKSDLYSLGATLYQLSTGLLPYSGSPAKVMSQIAAGALVPPVKRRATVGPDLSRVIEQLMASEVALRPENAAAVSLELRKLAAAGGFGDATEELAAYFEDPDAFLDKRRPAVVGAIVTSAKKALADSKLPRAMALADRASQLAPEDPAVKTLVESVTAGAGASARRRFLAIAGVGVLAAGVGAAGVVALSRGGGASVDAAIAVVDSAAPRDGEVVDGDLVATTELDAPAREPVDAFEPTVVVDAAPPVDARRPLVDAQQLTVARDAEPMLALDAPELPIDAAPVVPIDAPAPTGDGTLIVLNDTWCEVIVDGLARGQTSKNRMEVRLAAGHHVVDCVQGKGAGRVGWRREFDLEPGKTFTVQDSILKPVLVLVTFAVNIDGVDYVRGGQARLRAGRYSFKLGGKAGWLDVPQATRCTVREAGGELFCDP